MLHTHRITIIHQFIAPPSIFATFPYSFGCTGYGFLRINNVFQNTISSFSFVFRVLFLVTSFHFAWLLNFPLLASKCPENSGKTAHSQSLFRLSKTRDNQRINYSILAPLYNTTSIFSRVNSESKREKGGPKRRSCKTDGISSALFWLRGATFTTPSLLRPRYTR